LFITYYRDKYSSLGEFTAYIVIVLMQDVGRDGMKACGQGSVWVFSCLSLAEVSAQLGLIIPGTSILLHCHKIIILPPDFQTPQ